MEQWFPPAASPGIGRQRATPAAAPGQATKHKVITISKYNIHVLYIPTVYTQRQLLSVTILDMYNIIKLSMRWQREIESPVLNYSSYLAQ